MILKGKLESKQNLLNGIMLTASHFGEILRRRPITKPDALVMKILGNNSQKISLSMEWGRHHKSVAFELYNQKKLIENPEFV